MQRGIAVAFARPKLQHQSIDPVKHSMPGRGDQLNCQTNGSRENTGLEQAILRQFVYPPDLQDAATKTVLEQAELLAAQWATAM